MKKVYVDDTNRATIICPKCGFEKNIDAKNIRHIRKEVKVRCRCGETFEFIIEYRKGYRKNVNLRGEYILKEKKEMGDILIEDISMSGIRFSTFKKHRISENDMVEIKFTLDNPKRTEIATPVKIRWVFDRRVGAEFTDLNRHKQDLAFYLTI